MSDMDILNNTKVLVAAGVGASIALFSGGSVAGYFYAKKKLIVEYDERLERENDRARAYYKKLNKAEEFATPEAAAQALGVDMASGAEVNRSDEERAFDRAVAAMQSYRGQDNPNDGEVLHHRDKPSVSYNGVVVDSVSGETLGLAATNEPTGPVSRNVFSQESEPDTTVDFDYAEEVAARTNKRPYIVSKAEFEANERGHEQITMTYYEGDQTVSDINDQQVSLVDETIGWDNLRFGHRSDDNNVVYIRHEQYSLDMEIVRDERKYGEVVAGFVEGR